MAKPAALITVHGMGSTPRDYSSELIRCLEHELDASFARLHVESVYYQGILEANENRVWQKMSRKVRWDDLRKFLLFGFADAAGLEAGKDEKDSVYARAQVEIAKALLGAHAATAGKGKVLILAQSLGCQVVSCYFWDALKAKAGKAVNCGIWADIAHYWPRIAGRPTPTAAELAYVRGSHLRYLFTTGCNIPIFVAAHATDEIRPIQPNNTFVWKNFYDEDDVLGWPLAPLSAEYERVVRDIAINSGGGVMGWITSSWNPLSHLQYWRDGELLDPLLEDLRGLLA